MSTDLNVVCAKWGSLYSGEHVNRLFRGVVRNSARNVNFFCVTDDTTGIDSAINCLDLKTFSFQRALEEAQMKAPKKDGAFKKVAVFEFGLLPVSGPVLAFDLDVIITGNIDALADFVPGHVSMAPPFSTNAKISTLGEGSVIKFEPEHHGFLFSDMANSPASMVKEALGSEQSYTSARARARGVFSPFPMGWIVSFKRHCRPIRPLNAFMVPKRPLAARVICFHGRPNIDEAIDGFASDFFHKTMPAPWIAQHWK